MTLDLFFKELAYKELVKVDLPDGSHQHEINGVARLRDFFGGDVRGSVAWYSFSDRREPETFLGSYRFYDSRARGALQTGRSPEWRFYYTADFLKRAKPGDVLVFALTLDDRLLALLFEAESAYLRAFSSAAGWQDLSSSWAVSTTAQLEAERSYLVALLDELDLPVEMQTRPSLEGIAERELGAAAKAGATFPTSQRIGELARQGVDFLATEIDRSVLNWLQAEEELFRAIERIVVEKRLENRFDSVDDFVSYSLSVHNRRKSRMGLALQNHLAEAFRLSGVRFDAQAITEGRNKPDFVFPGHSQYHRRDFDSERLAMLAAKSSCKERWRQILSEANRIPHKHLCTLERAISESQTDEMKNQNVQLVVPEPLQPAFTVAQQKWLWSLQAFVDLVRRNQGN